MLFFPSFCDLIWTTADFQQDMQTSYLERIEEWHQQAVSSPGYTKIQVRNNFVDDFVHLIGCFTAVQIIEGIVIYENVRQDIRLFKVTSVVGKQPELVPEAARYRLNTINSILPHHKDWVLDHLDFTWWKSQSSRGPTNSLLSCSMHVGVYPCERGKMNQEFQLRNLSSWLHFSLGRPSRLTLTKTWLPGTQLQDMDARHSCTVCELIGAQCCARDRATIGAGSTSDLYKLIQLPYVVYAGMVRSAGQGVGSGGRGGCWINLTDLNEHWDLCQDGPQLLCPTENWPHPRTDRDTEF